MSDQSTCDTTTEPGVWDADHGPAVTAALCAGVRSLQADPRRTGVDGHEVLRRSAGLLAQVERQAERIRPGLAHGYEAGDVTDPVVLATATGLTLGAEVVDRPDPMGRWQVIAVAALDAVGMSDDTVTLGDLASVLSATLAAAPALQRVFEHAGSQRASDAWITVGALATGVGVGLLTGPDDDERLSRIVGLVASCSAATGPSAFGGDAEAVLLGRAAGNAIMCARLVDTGFSVNSRTLEAPRGLLRSMTGSVPSDDATAELRALMEVAAVASGRPTDDVVPWKTLRRASLSQEER